MTMQAVRQAVLKDCPDLKYHEKHPRQLVWGLALVSLALLLSAALIHGLRAHSLSYLSIGAMSLLLGLVFGLGGLYAHELLHGSILYPNGIASRFVVRTLSWLGFLIFGCSPELWLTWHNRVHHFHTNEAGVDPDSFGLWSEFQKMPMSGFVLNRAPGTRHWLAWIYLPLNFSNQVLTVMWFFLWKGDPRLFAPVRKPVAMAETFAMYLFWAVFAWFFGAAPMLWVFLVPALIANLVVSSFILVQHLLCPLDETGDPLDNTLGVSLPAWMDRLTFFFGHHIEHHCFPEANHSVYPRMRQVLMNRYRERYRLLPHATALRMLLSTPRVYRDPVTLLDPKSGRTVDVSGMGLMRPWPALGSE